MAASSGVSALSSPRRCGHERRDELSVSGEDVQDTALDTGPDSNAVVIRGADSCLVNQKLDGDPRKLWRPESQKNLKRRVIARCEDARKIPSMTQMMREAVDIFYDEYDYYPTLATYAPGTFMIMGDHLEYVKGNLVQCALPFVTLVVGTSFCSLKCKLYTTSKNVEGLKKSVFPISHYKKNLKVFPQWVNYIKGVINCFPYEDVSGFDAVIHSSVPFYQAYGSSAALQVSFYTFLEACTGKTKQDKRKIKGNLCRVAERLAQMCDKRIGEWSNLTSSMAEKNRGVLIDCRTEDVTLFDMRETDILFLLIYPNFEIERKDRDLVVKRELELKLAAKLLGLEEIIDATGRDLEALGNMEDPTRETVISILRSFGADEKIIQEIVDELFYFPEIESIPGEEYGGEGGSYEIRDLKEHLGEGEEEIQGEIMMEEGGEEEEEEEEKKGYPKPCIPKTGGRATGKIIIPPPPPVSYIQKRIAELCENKKGLEIDLPHRVCEEINCLGGLENLSVDSDVTVCGKLMKRLRHVVTENLRSLELPEIISRLDYEEFGTKLIQSHLSLKLDFDVSCATLDGLVQLAIDAESVYGAKMMSGGGVLVLLHRRVLDCFIGEVIMKFGDRFQFYSVFPSSGAKITSVGMRRNPKSTLSKPFLCQDELLKSAVEQFEILYKYRPTHGAYAPGVVQILGDHTDYNHGLGLSMGVTMLTIVVGAFNGTTKVRAATTMALKDDPQRVIFVLPEGEGDLRPGTVKWAKYIKGVIAEFKGANSLKGFDCLIASSVPCGIALASKAALTSSFYTFLEELTGNKTKNATEKAQRCMLAQHEFSNLLCGISEVTTSIKSRKNFITLIDSRSTKTHFLPFQNPGLTFLLTVMNSEMTKKKALFYLRLEECYDVARVLGGKTLRCLTLKHIDALRNSNKKIPEYKLRRAAHIIQENERILKAAEALKNSEMDVVGELLVASHNSLRDNYEVVIPKVDTLVRLSMEVDGVLGSKIMCSSVKPCMISLVKLWAVDDVIEYLQKSSDADLEFYVLNPSEGCSRLDVKGYVETLPSPQFVFEDIFPF